MDDLAARFEANRTHLRAVAYRMLGSRSEAEDAVQEAWLRLSRSGADDIENLRGWLTTVVARVCLDQLRARKLRREQGLDDAPPEKLEREGGFEHETELADGIGVALLVVLETLTPAERVAFVLHDLFDFSFDDIAPIVGRSSTSARQLASRARRRVRGADVPTPDPEVGRQREVVDAFFAAARRGDFDALVSVLDPDIVERVDAGPARPDITRLVRGASVVAGRAIMFDQPSARLRPVLVNGTAGVVVTVGGEPFAVMAFTVSGGRIAEIDVLADADRLNRLDVAGRNA